jgi:7-carboxy-7-deazaguanine synthase
MNSDPLITIGSAEIQQSTAELALATSYPVMEHFYTIQGEGYWTGNAAYFIRLGGCDVGCFWCDVKDSWDAEKHPRLTVHHLLNVVQETLAPRVVITGGEPLMHNLSELTATLKQAGLHIHLETSGAYPLSGQIDWITFSPKKFKAPLAEIYQYAHELKVVVYNRHDLEFAEYHAALCHPYIRKYLQPEWSRPESMEWIVDYVKQHPDWQISLQTHKWMNVP